MPAVARSVSLPVDPEAVWRLIADPHNLPRWWPRTVRVESVEGDPGARRSRFTQVLETQRGAPVRADWRTLESTRPRRLLWEQQIEGTPFEKFLRGSELEISIEPAAEGARVRLEGRRRLRGLSRLGAPMMARATGRTLDQALEGVGEALVGSADR